MNTDRSNDNTKIMARTPLSLAGAHRRTLEEIFRHPSAHNLEWRHVVALLADIGDVHEKPHGELMLQVAGKRHYMRRPHSKDLTSSEVVDLRHFLKQVGVSAEPASEPVADPDPAAK